MGAERWILHADMDAFYASIEQRDHPELRGLPVIVGATSPRGVVAAASYEARRFGVRSAMPGFRARQLCPGGVYLPSNMALYAQVSRQIQALFHDFTPLVEPLALDEAFLDVSGSMDLFGGIEALARELKRRVLEATGLCVSVGAAPNKLVAKIACNLGKPDGLRVIAASEVRHALDPLAIGELWGVGPVLERKLQAIGVRTFGELARLERAPLEALVGRRASELQALARGEDTREVEAQRSPKSIGEENTFESDVQSEARVDEVLRAHADAVARRLRRAGYRGRTIHLKIKLARADAARAGARGPQYPLLSRSKTLPDATDDAEQISSVARALWRSAALRVPIRLLGVSVSALESSGGGQGQLGLFEPGAARSRASSGAGAGVDPIRARGRLGPTLDAITERFGSQAIGRAVEAPGKVTHGRGIKRGS
ncbi:MAG TPA: DNA polymerase IV [Polyangiaceae bacterium]|nr:DNA polymerase IV [Polyangiaceae bacterium]